MKIKETEAAIEAILFAMGGSVELPRIARAIGVDEKTTGRIIRNMMTVIRKRTEASRS